ncbi:hypothetical protein JMJ77_0010897, partial [Colletotrichum scovillei]
MYIHAVMLRERSRGRHRTIIRIACCKTTSLSMSTNPLAYTKNLPKLD